MDHTPTGGDSEKIPAATLPNPPLNKSKEERRAEGRARALEIAKLRKAKSEADDDVESSKVHGGHGSHNSKRANAFVRWVKKTFDATVRGGVVDVAGGNGEVSVRLNFCEHIPATTVDVREADLISTLSKRIVPKLPKKWQSKLAGKSAEELLAISDDPGCGSVLPRQVVDRWDSLTQVEASPVLMSAVHSSSVLVGLHSDASTEAIVDVALKYNKSFAVVPCCVFPNLFKKRRLKGGEVVRR